MSPTFRAGVRSLYVQTAFVLGGLLVAFPDLATAQANASLLGTVTDETGAGKITRTRFPTGEAGSSRQIQLAVKLWF